MIGEEKKIRFGIVGAGKPGAFHARALAKQPGACLTFLYDLDSARAEKIAQSLHAAACTNLSDWPSKIDAVLLTGPTHQPYEKTLFFLQNGIHVLLEQPLSLTLREIKKLFQTAREKQVILQIGHLDRFNSAFLEAKKHIHQPVYLSFNRQGPFEKKPSGNPLILEHMLHDLDLLHLLIPGQITRMDTTGLRVFSEEYDLVNVRISFDSGIVATLQAGRTNFEKTRQMEIFQPKSSVLVDFINTRVKTYRKDTPLHNGMQDLTVTYPKVDRVPPLLTGMLHFIHEIQKFQKKGYSPDLGTPALEWAIRIMEQLDTPSRIPAKSEASL